jgi:hypothetical protein
MTDTLPINTIWVRRDLRQRRSLEADPHLEASIRRVGLINPVVVTKEFRLIAGERRWEACKAIGMTDIPIRWAEELPESETRIIELEENLKRRDLAWQDSVRAVADIHRLYGERDPTWNQKKTAECTSLDEGYVSTILLVASHMKDPKVSSASTVNEARNLIQRRKLRASEAELNELAEFARQHFGPSSGGASNEKSNIHHPPRSGDGDIPVVAANAATPKPPVPIEAAWTKAAVQRTIIKANFLEWAPAYDGQPFNFIHCDFPYGVGVFAGDGQFKPEDQDNAYDDKASDYWALVECLVKNLTRLSSMSSHIMFWLSPRPRIVTETLALFASRGPQIEWLPYPLIWHKSDATGIVGDSQRWLRHTYEAALLGYRGRRPLVKTAADSYSAPGDRKLHPSCKPEPMLRHFFSAIVDDHTRMLDPTCGSGAAIRAAESLGARPENTLGLEIEDRFVSVSREALQHFRLNHKAADIAKKATG